MRYKEFEVIGVEVYADNEIEYTRYCDTLKEAIEYAKDRVPARYTCKFITCDKYGCKIQEL